MMGVGHLNTARALMRSFAPESVEECTDIETLQAQLEQQNLILQTMLVLLLEKKVISEDEFNEWATKVDELDGVRDGRLSGEKSPIRCPDCGHENLRGAAKCVNCGVDLDLHLIQKLK